jgi:hypothetical protein
MRSSVGPLAHQQYVVLLCDRASSKVGPPLRQILPVDLARQILLNAVVGERCRSDARNGGIVLGSAALYEIGKGGDGDDMIDTLELEVARRQ